LLCAATVSSTTAGAAVTAGSTRAVLEQLQADGQWGEAELASGRVRAFRVLEVSADSVVVNEIIGALHERRAQYGLQAIHSVRPLGLRRIPLRPAPYRPRRSPVLALGLETLVPGAGYFYAGEARQGYALIAVSAAAVATGVATGKDGAAGWIPFIVWTKVASLLHLSDQVSAMNAARESGPAAGVPGQRLPRQGAVPGLSAGVRIAF